MSYQFEINSLIELIISVSAVITAAFLLKYRRTPGVRYLIILELLIGVWALTYAFEFANPSLDVKIFWSQASYLGIAFLPVLYFLFTTGFSQKSGLITTKNIILLSIIPIIMICLVFTNSMHHLVWTNVMLDPDKNIAYYFHGPAFWIFFIFTEILIFAGLYNLVSSIKRFSSFYRPQVYILIVASAIPIIGNLLYLSGINPYPGFDWTPLSFVLTGVIVFFGILRYRMFNLIPIARNKLLDTLSDSIVVVSSKGIIEDNNQAALELTGNVGIKITGKPFHEVFSEFTGLAGAFDPSSEKKLEIPATRNTEMYFEVIITPVSDEYNSRTGYLVLFHDITEIKKAQASILETNKKLRKEIENKEKLIEDLDAFAHTVAHDIKNPMSSIVSSVSLIPECIERKDMELLEELTKMIQVSANKSIYITNELLTLSSVRKEEVKTSPIKMADILEEALARLSYEITEKKVQILKSNSWPTVMGYAAWIEEVWFNYLINAIKYGGSPPVLNIGSEKLHNGQARFWVEDNGNGIRPEDQPLLFNQFTRLNVQQQGHGLGLSIARRIIEKLGGSVGVESTGSTGGGSRFYFQLPLAGK